MDARRVVYLAVALSLVSPTFSADARGFGGGGGFRGGGGGFHGYSGRATSGGFDLQHDTPQHFNSGFGDHEAAPSHPDTNRNTSYDGNNFNHNDANNFNHNGNNNYNHNGNNNYNHNDFNNNNVNINHNVVVNPQGYGNWGWHGGVAWAPVGSYWGGGFWGGFAAGAIVAGTTAAIIASSAPQYPVQYVVAPASPGAQLLSDYGLTQSACGPDSVVINYSGSVICAAPNGRVSPGNYTVNVSTLTLQST